MEWFGPYREDKATQASARLLRHAGGTMNRLVLIKLLYLADRAALVRFGRPITFDTYFSLPHGPICSETLNRSNARPDPKGARSYWQEYIVPKGRWDVELLQDAPTDELSPVEEKLLDEIFEEHGQLSRLEIEDLSHGLPEWKDPGSSSLPIRVKDILIAGGLADSDAEAIIAELQAEAATLRALA